MQINIAHITYDNTELLNLIVEDGFDKEVDFNFLSSYVKSHIMLAALKNGVVIGQVSSVIQNHIDIPMELYIDDLGVTPLCQRQSVAIKLITITKKWVVKKYGRPLFLDASKRHLFFQ